MRPQLVTTIIVVKEIIDIGQSLIGACRGLPRRVFHVQSFVREFVIEDFNVLIET